MMVLSDPAYGMTFGYESCWDIGGHTGDDIAKKYTMSGMHDGSVQHWSFRGVRAGRCM